MSPKIRDFFIKILDFNLRKESPVPKKKTKAVKTVKKLAKKKTKTTKKK